MSVIQMIILWCVHCEAIYGAFQSGVIYIFFQTYLYMNSPAASAFEIQVFCCSVSLWGCCQALHPRMVHYSHAARANPWSSFPLVLFLLRCVGMLRLFHNWLQTTGFDAFGVSWPVPSDVFGGNVFGHRPHLIGRLGHATLTRRPRFDLRPAFAALPALYMTGAVWPVLSDTCRLTMSSQCVMHAWYVTIVRIAAVARAFLGSCAPAGSAPSSWKCMMVFGTCGFRLYRSHIVFGRWFSAFAWMHAFMLQTIPSDCSCCGSVVRWISHEQWIFIQHRISIQHTGTCGNHSQVHNIMAAESEMGTRRTAHCSITVLRLWSMRSWLSLVIIRNTPNHAASATACFHYKIHMKNHRFSCHRTVA